MRGPVPSSPASASASAVARAAPRLRAFLFRRKIGWGIAVAAALIVLVTGTSAVALKMALDGARAASRRAEELVALTALRGAVDARVSSFRGYMLSGDPRYLARLRRERAQVLSHLRELRTAGIGADDAALLLAIAEADRGYEEAAAAGLLLRAGGASADELGQFIERTSGPRREALDRALDAVGNHKRDELREAERTFARRTLTASALILASGGLAFLLVIGLAAPVTKTLATLFETESRERSRAEEAGRRAALLAKASTALASSLDYRTRLASIARLAVPQFADWCLVDVADESGTLRRLAVTHSDPAKEERMRRVTDRYPDDPAAPYGPPNVLRTGTAELGEEVTEKVLRGVARDEEHYQALRSFGFRSWMSVPMAARGRTFGVLTFVSAESGTRYGPADLEFARDLAHRASLAIDNARLYKEAQEAIAARDEFLSIASHELKTPVTTLQLQVQSLQRSSESGASVDRSLPVPAERLAGANRQIERLTRLINDLLDISRITGHRLKLELERVDLAEIAREVVARHEADLTRARCTVRLSADEPSEGRWDRLRVEQIVTNILSNAIKYGAGQPIDVTVDGDDGRARLTVRDRGIGIAPEHQARIFQRFERAVSGTHYGGFGLGLWIVRQIVDAHGGDVSVSSEPGEGSTFVVELPREPDDRAGGYT